MLSLPELSVTLVKVTWAPTAELFSLLTMSSMRSVAARPTVNALPLTVKFRAPPLAWLELMSASVGWLLWVPNTSPGAVSRTPAVAARVLTVPPTVRTAELPAVCVMAMAPVMWRPEVVAVELAEKSVPPAADRAVSNWASELIWPPPLVPNVRVCVKAWPPALVPEIVRVWPWAVPDPLWALTRSYRLVELLVLLVALSTVRPSAVLALLATALKSTLALFAVRVSLLPTMEAVTDPVAPRPVVPLISAAMAVRLSVLLRVTCTVDGRRAVVFVDDKVEGAGRARQVGRIEFLKRRGAVEGTGEIAAEATPARAVGQIDGGRCGAEAQRRLKSGAAGRDNHAVGGAGGIDEVERGCPTR